MNTWTTLTRSNGKQRKSLLSECKRSKFLDQKWQSLLLTSVLKSYEISWWLPAKFYICFYIFIFCSLVFHLVEGQQFTRNISLEGKVFGIIVVSVGFLLKIEQQKKFLNGQLFLERAIAQNGWYPSINEIKLFCCQQKSGTSNIGWYCID